MKFEKDNLQGEQARKVLRAVMALWGGTSEQANAIRFEGDPRDLLYDLSGLQSLPHIKLEPLPDRCSQASCKVLMESGATSFYWESPKASYDSQEQLGVLLTFYTRKVLKPEPKTEHYMNVLVNLKDIRVTRDSSSDYAARFLNHLLS